MGAVYAHGCPYDAMLKESIKKPPWPPLRGGWHGVSRDWVSALL